MIARLLTPPPDILLVYDDLRRRENEILLRVVDVLPRVDGLPPAVLEQARDAVFHTDHPFLLALVGPFGVGKSSLINALLGEDVLLTGPVPTTDQITVLRYGEQLERLTGQDEQAAVFYPAEFLKAFSLVDTPGLESVFTQHSDRTDAFLHRCDWVVLVMLATQALSASNVAYLETLKGYGKRVVVVVNQVDLLDDSQRDIVQNFVQEQYQVHLGSEPEVFLVSSRQGLAAQQSDPVDQAGWQASGLAELESFILHALDDRERLRQKLQTPLQIARHVLTQAQEKVQEQQRALDGHRTIQSNIEAQIATGREQQREQVGAALDQIAVQFAETAQRGEDAIHDLFQPTRAIGQVTSGLTELLGLAGLARRMGVQSRAAAAFATYAVVEPLNDVPKLTDDLGPTLEGRDMQDMDDLVVYVNKALDELPAELQAKVIGTVSPPVSYNREPLRSRRADLESSLGAARQLETERLDGSVRNALVMLAGWELAIIIAVVLLGVLAVDWANVAVPLVMVLGALALMFLGVAFFALRGHQLANQFTARMVEHSQDYQKNLREAAEDQITYGVGLRQDVVAPFTRLIKAQASLLADLAADLRQLEDEAAAFAGSIGGLGE
ncbi:dynamin family protein [Chloroflexota bacterium]